MTLLKFKRAGVFRIVQIISITALIQACASPSEITITPNEIEIPAQWQTKSTESNIAPTLIDDFNKWLNEFGDRQLVEIVNKALKNNRDLKTELITLQLAKENLIQSKADRFPEISLGLNARREKLVNDNDISSFQTQSGISADIDFEVDLWGKLSDQQKQYQLSYAAAKATFTQQQITIITSVIKQWYNIVEANKLLELFTGRAKNLDNNLSMIESSYNLGLAESLDVYLSRNNLNSELAIVAEQKQNVKIATRELELLLGEYPAGVLEANADLIKFDNNTFANIPSNLLTQRQSIKASWLTLLSLDAGLAVAHKQRFPSLSLSASIGESSSEISQLLNGNALAWSLLGNLVTPIFNGGALASEEEQARLAVVQQEQYYLTEVYNAFLEVENVLSNHTSLLKRFELQEEAEMNAIAAQELSFDQYMRGLVSYTTVLEAERRAFDAQTSLIQIKNDLIQNRADTFLALGGVLNSEWPLKIEETLNKQEQ